jgi:hypothetical protein
MSSFYALEIKLCLLKIVSSVGNVRSQVWSFTNSGLSYTPWIPPWQTRANSSLASKSPARNFHTNFIFILLSQTPANPKLAMRSSTNPNSPSFHPLVIHRSPQTFPIRFWLSAVVWGQTQISCLITHWYSLCANLFTIPKKHETISQIFPKNHKFA